MSFDPATLAILSRLEKEYRHGKFEALSCVEEIGWWNNSTRWDFVQRMIRIPSFSISGNVCFNTSLVGSRGIIK